jgi:L-ascorbate metabolism protein UlaG (beta-lactamase superfamily)
MTTTSNPRDVLAGDLLGVTLTPIGGPTVLLEVGGLRFLVDPTFDAPGTYPIGNRALVKRTGPALPAEELPAIDAVLLSHDQHPDNLDRLGRTLVDHAPLTLTTPAAHERLGGSTVGLEPWASYDVRGTHSVISVTAVPALHGPEGSESLAGPVTGFVLHGRGLPTVYVSGDNASLHHVDEIAAAFPEIPVSILFAGAARTALIPEAPLTLTSADAARAAARLRSRWVLTVHTEGWEHFTEGPDLIEQSFAAAGLSDRLVRATPGTPTRL